MKLLSELSPKFCELARTDSLPYAFHSVKEERQIVVGQQDTREHLAGLIQMPNKRPSVAPADGTCTRLVKRLLIQAIPCILDIQFAS